jgi:Rv2525c-like, glycoside hydrolase-like domain
MSSRESRTPADDRVPAATTYLGFDRNIYPGDDALPILRKTFAFSSYWLSPPPGEKINTWRGKRELLHSLGFGFAVLYRGRASREFKTPAQAKEKGALDARDTIASAKAEGFVSGTVIFLDIEEGGRLSPPYHAYLRAWAEDLARAGYRPGVYCSAVVVNEGRGVTILTSDDIRKSVSPIELIYWVFNDVCPPAPGCVAPKNPPPVSASGVSYAAIWQFAQSPRRKERTARCASTYNADGNCYAPGDTSHAWFLDVNSATSADPSAAK